MVQFLDTFVRFSVMHGKCCRHFRAEAQARRVRGRAVGVGDPAVRLRAA